MTNRQLEIKDCKKESEYKKYSNYRRKFMKENIEKFINYSNYDFDKITLKKNIGEEARTFHILNNSIPLLSPSRISKIFTDYKFWNIPKQNLTKPRLFGQCAHKIIEIYNLTGNLIILDNETLKSWFLIDYDFLLKSFNQEYINFLIRDINEAVRDVLDFLDKNNIKVIQVEKHIANEMFHGFVDILAIKEYKKSNMRVPMIIDLKFSSMKEISNSWKAQLAIYNEIFNNTAQCYILSHDRNTKEVKLTNIPHKELDKSIEAIKVLINLYRDINNEN